MARAIDRAGRKRRAVLPAGLIEFAGERLEADSDYDSLLFTDTDLSGQEAADCRFLECHLRHCNVDGASLRRARLADSLIADAYGASFDLADSIWRDSELRGGRLGAIALPGARWSRVDIRDVKIGYLNMAAAQVDDALFEGCEIETFDMRAARLHSVELIECHIGELNLAEATLAKVDLSRSEIRRIASVENLRGSLVSHDQLTDLAPMLAAQLGIEVRKD